MTAPITSAVTAAAPSHGALEGGPQPVTADALSPPRPTTRCRYRRCNQRFIDHIDGACPDFPGRTFQRWTRHKSAVDRISMSFAPREMAAVQELLRMMQRNGDPRVVAGMYRKELGNVLGKASRSLKRNAARKKSAAVACAPSAALSTPLDASDERRSDAAVADASSEGAL